MDLCILWTWICKCVYCYSSIYISIYVHLKWLWTERASMDRYLVYFLSNFMCGYDIPPRVPSFFFISWVFLEPYLTFSRFHVVLEHYFCSVPWEVLVAYFMLNFMRGSGILLYFFERFGNPMHNFYMVPWQALLCVSLLSSPMRLWNAKFMTSP